MFWWLNCFRKKRKAKKPAKGKRSFTLLELLIVIAILGVLGGFMVNTFKSAQVKARDTQRKADLKAIVNSLELLRNDVGKYPLQQDEWGPPTLIKACMYIFETPSLSGACSWGEGHFKMFRGGEIATVYMATIPKDPSSNQYYVYTASPDGKAFRIFARLENPNDPNIFNDPSFPAISTECSSTGDLCNFVMWSPNVTPVPAWGLW